MRNLFRHYFPPTDAEFKELWANAVFAFDASALLNIYGYSSETRTALVEVINNNANRLVLPHQFGLEFSRNRCSVLMKQVRNYVKIETELERIRAQFLNPKRDHPHLTEEFMIKYESIVQELANCRKEMEGLITHDPFLEKLLDAFEGKVGTAPTKNEIERLREEARERYNKKIPPGFADNKKGIPEAFGDYIGWRQLMNISSASGKDIILIIDDVKDDWWHIEHQKKTIGPRPELLEEFFRECQHKLYLYTSEQFLRFAKQMGATDIPDSVIQEVGQRLESQSEQDRLEDQLKERSEDQLKESSTDAKLYGHEEPDEAEMKMADDLKESSPDAPEKARSFDNL